MSKVKRSIISWLVLSPLVVAILFPYAVMLITALKPATEVLRPTWWPSELRLSNFVEMWSVTNFGQALLNSLYVSGVATIAALIVSIPGAYALSRYRFAGRGAYRTFLLVSQMLSPIVLVLGLFRLVVSLGSSTTSIRSSSSTRRSTSPSRCGCCRAILRQSRTISRRRRGSRGRAASRRSSAFSCRLPFRRWW
jgi:ABC-type glycerol-3-phosphate transport system permease component